MRERICFLESQIHKNRKNKNNNVKSFAWNFMPSSIVISNLIIQILIDIQHLFAKVTIKQSLFDMNGIISYINIYHSILVYAYINCPFVNE